MDYVRCTPSTVLRTNEMRQLCIIPPVLRRRPDTLDARLLGTWRGPSLGPRCMNLGYDYKSVVTTARHPA